MATCYGAGRPGVGIRVAIGVHRRPAVLRCAPCVSLPLRDPFNTGDAAALLAAGVRRAGDGHADLPVRPLPGLAGRSAAERDPHSYDLCRRHAARQSVPQGWHLADRAAALARSPPRRLTRGPAPDLPTGSEARSAGRRLAWSDVPVTSRLPLRAAGARSTPPFAVMAWLAAFVVGQTLAVIILIGRGRRPRRQHHRHPRRSSRRALDRLPGRRLVGVEAIGLGSAGGGLPAALAPLDVIGIPLGVLTQLVLVPLVYWPLELLARHVLRRQAHRDGRTPGRPG